MADLHYCQYAFAQAKCRVEEIGPGVDPRFRVELICEGLVAAVASRIGLDRFVPERLRGKTSKDIRWLGEIAARHNEIICKAAASSAVLPLRLGTVFQSLDSLRTVLVQRRRTIAELLHRLDNRHEWGVKLYLEKRRLEPTPDSTNPPPPHFLGPHRGTVSHSGERPAAAALARCCTAPGMAYPSQKQNQIEGRPESRARLRRTIEDVERCLANKAEHCCRIRALPNSLPGRSDKMVFNAAFLLPSSAQTNWLQAIHRVSQDVQDQGLVLEVSGPWPPYHFCPSLDMPA
jgi:hypothetical protein